MRTSVFGLLFLLIVISIGVTFLAHTHTASTSSVSSRTVAIPGDNLALGENKNTTVGTYLVGYNGHALYIYELDTASSTCTQTCASVWHPYLVTSTRNLVGESPIIGTISTTRRADGSFQLTYDSHPLYFYGIDTAYTITGSGVDPAWQLARP